MQLMKRTVLNSIVVGSKHDVFVLSEKQTDRQADTSHEGTATNQPSPHEQHKKPSTVNSQVSMLKSSQYITVNLASN